MQKKWNGLWVVVLAVVALAASSGEPLPIIPGAAGFGIETVAGSGRHLDVPKTRVIKVTNLNTGGPGSLGAALDAEGSRVVVFEVSGNIDFTPVGGLSIKHPYLTVAGQTAPSPGITLKGCQLHVRASDVLLQHIRVRVGDLLDPSRPVRNEKSGWTQFSERDCMKVGRACRRVVIDHCSFSWATDENVQTRGGDLTFIHNIFSEGLHSAKHHKGGHSRGLIIMKQGKDEGQNIAVIGNLFAHNKGRNPTVNGGAVAVVANNLVDNAHFAMKGDCTAKRGHQLISAMGNVIKRTRYPVVARAKHPDTRYYFAPDNVFNGKTFDSVADVWKDVLMPFEPGVPEVNRAVAPPVTVPGLELRPVGEVEEWVLANAGARPADRGPVDKRIVGDVRNGTGEIIASQEDVGGWPKLEENYRKLTIPNNPDGDDDGDGYTNLEEWLHKFAADVEG
jgi:pectate lyase